MRDGPPKTASSAAVIEDLAPQTILALLALPTSDDPACPYVLRTVSGLPFDPDVINHKFAEHLKLAGLPSMPFHALRHTTATFILNAGPT